MDPQVSSPLAPSPESSSRNWSKIILSSILGLLLASAFLFFGYQLGKSAQSPKSSDIESPPPSQVSTIDSGIPITDNVVSFARTAGDIYLRYKNKVYGSVPQGELDLVILPVNQDDYIWYGLVDTPSDSIGTFDSIFDFRLLGDKNFLFVLRLDRPINNSQNQFRQEFPVYYYDVNRAGNKVSELLSFMESDVDYNFPKIDKISSDNSYISFKMYGCWNCGGHQPETLLYNLKTGASKRIGKTSYFAWRSNGEYEYKDYKVIDCAPEPMGPGECSEDPKNLPLRSGQF